MLLSSTLSSTELVESSEPFEFVCCGCFVADLRRPGQQLIKPVVIDVRHLASIHKNLKPRLGAIGYLRTI